MSATIICDLCSDTGELPAGDACSACCSHDEHDHGVCLDCGEDRSSDLAGAAEFARECREDR